MHSHLLISRSDMLLFLTKMDALLPGNTMQDSLSELLHYFHTEIINTKHRNYQYRNYQYL